jgi:hypothetical protein
MTSACVKSVLNWPIGSDAFLNHPDKYMASRDSMPIIYPGCDIEAILF